jgi:Flp pilus assembly protein TadG
MRRAPRSEQSGGTAVEFALVLLIFLTFLLAVTDFSRMLYTWNAASEATRAGARYAAVCDTTANKPQVLAKMQATLPQITDINLNLAWIPTDCTPESCEGVTVTIVGLKYQWISPIAGLSMIAPMPMPTFRTFLTREIMGMDPNSGTIC